MAEAISEMYLSGNHKLGVRAGSMGYLHLPVKSHMMMRAYGTLVQSFPEAKGTYFADSLLQRKSVRVR